MLVLALAAVAIAISGIAPLILRPLLIKRGVLDVATARSTHTGTAVRGLGIGVWIAADVVWLLALVRVFQAQDWISLSYGAVLFLVVNAAAGIGMIEDVRGMSVRLRSVAQLAIAVLTVWGFTAAELEFGAGSLPAISGSVPVFIAVCVFAIFYISSYINVANFMDGINGISAIHAIIAGLTFTCVGFLVATPWIAIAGIIMASSFAAFLPWNLGGYGFLGDVGSYLLGGSVVSLSFGVLFFYPELWLIAISPTVIYFGDVGWTLLRRVRAGEKWYTPHKEHVYQKLQQSGFSHLQVAVIVGGMTMLAVGLSFLSLLIVSWWWYAILLALGFGVVVLYMNLPRILKKRAA
ncbi:UDP-phosphate alpha-N-acetyl-D-fucosaminephosphotransferase [Canibacter sp. lx-45]|uniref:UDP-phosphate alpha-N-acetyl-D-fucosaminephosphotransferase n=1 Tax=Canibacter zhuwentaonis TaxID=2837491 RepID=UPI001BDC5E40|nr:UDP-phosphate alpha-N-acetyl-D-fucosaminephosphotransferase [Canibacter zhuwentaonis]MBT1035505.1 UDP-phosphate alpha-N-acetyl-D-fucosaminephosphotransferase [Canibacter zhuwentaonis]